MSDITLRLVKGLPLTNQEVDDNFANLNTDKYQAGDSASFQDVTLDNMSGPITWNVDDGTVDVPLNAQVTLQLGQEFVFYAKATEVITNGDVVMFAGAQGGHLLIAKCDMGAVGFDPSHIVGVATQSFAINDFGYVTSSGKVRGIDTSGFAEGTILYVDPTTAGGYTSTKPAPPNHIVQIAAVTRSHATQGTILTRVSHMPDTDEVPEGSTNLYFTDARAVSAIKADGAWNASDWDTAFGWGNHATEGYLTSVAFNDLTSTPTTISGYGITDAFDGAYSSLSGAPTTVSSFTNDSGYITDYTVTQGDVTAHQAALSITESQISDLGNYLTSETNTTLQIVGNTLRYTDETGTNTDIDLSLYLDDTNLSRLISGSLDANGTATFTRDDDSTFTVDFSQFFDDTNLARITSAAFNTADGVLTLTRDDATTITADLDGRYLTSYTESDTLQSVTNRGATTTNKLEINTAGTQQLVLGTTNSSFDGAGNVEFRKQDDTLTGRLSMSYSSSFKFLELYTNFVSDASEVRKLRLYVGGDLKLTKGTNEYKVWDASDFSSTKISNWDTAYGWGNHASAGYLTSHQDISGKADLSGDTFTGPVSFTESGSTFKIDPHTAGVDLHSTGNIAPHYQTNFTLYTGNIGSGTQRLSLDSSGNLSVTGTLSASGYNKSNWDTAYGWGDHSTQNYATQTYVNNAVSNLVDSSPSTLDTLNELAAALGDDANFSTTVTNSIATKWTQDNNKISNWDDAYEQQHSWEWRWQRWQGTVQPSADTTEQWQNYYNTYFVKRTTAIEASHPFQDSGYLNTIDDVDSTGGFGGSTYGNMFGDLSTYHCLIYTNIYVDKEFTVNITNFSGDDPHAIFVDGKFVHGRIPCCTDTAYSYTFTQGWHRIDLVYSEGGGGDWIRMGWNPKDYTANISDMTPYRGGDNPIYLSDKINAVNNSSNWNTAYGWGDHSTEGYLTSFTETDPTVPSHVKSITTANISNWDTAYTYSQVGHLPLSGGELTGKIKIQSGDVATRKIVLWDGPFDNDYQFYGFGIEPSTLLQSIPASTDFFRWFRGDTSTTRTQLMELDGSGNLSTIGTLSASGYNKSNWDTAYGWGNHSTQGYLTEVPSPITKDLVIGGSVPASWGRPKIGTYNIGWGENPSIGSDGGTAGQLIMLANPHIPYRTDNARNGASGRAGIRCGIDATQTSWWDIGLTGDQFEIYRNSSATVLMGLNNTGDASFAGGVTTGGQIVSTHDNTGTDPYVQLKLRNTGTSAGIRLHCDITGGLKYEIQSDIHGDLIAYDRTNGAYRLRLNSSGVDAPNGGFLINGTTVIDSSRNLININQLRYPTTELDFNAGPHTTTHPMSIKLWDNYQQSGAPSAYGTVLDIHGRSGHAHNQLYFEGNTNNLRMRRGWYGNNNWSGWTLFWNSDNFATGSDTRSFGALQIGGTTVIDSSRNLTNVGNITATGQLNIDRGADDAIFIDTTVADNTTRPAIKLYEDSAQATGRQSLQWYNGNQGYIKADIWTEVGNSYNATKFGIDVADNARAVATRLFIQDGNTYVTGSFFGSKSIRIGSGGSYQAGSIYSDGNWGMIFRAAQASPNQAYYRWADSGDTELMRIDTSGNLDVKLGGYEVNQTTVISSSRQLKNVIIDESDAEYGQSMVGNWGQWYAHNGYTDFNLEPPTWGWTYVNSLTSNNPANSPPQPSSQWYRGRYSLGNEYGKGSDSGDYWMEMAVNRFGNGNNTGVGGMTNAHMWIRTCEAGAERSWYEVGANLYSGLKIRNTAIIDTSRNLTNIGTINASGTITTSGQITVGSGATASYIMMSDSDQGGRYIHCNSNRVGFLTSASGWGSWCNDDGSWESGSYISGSDLRVSGTTVIDSSRNLSNITSLNITSSTGNITFANSGTTKRGIYGTMGDNDQWFIGGGATSSNVGYLEISTGDDGQNTSGGCEEILVRQYGPGTPLTGTLHRTLKLLDNYGNTSIPGNLQVFGSITATGNITAYSDRRLKDNIKTLDGSKVYQMRGVSFTKDGEQGSGVIAQELEQVAPELVMTNDDEMQTKSVAYGNVVGYLIEAIKELKLEIEELKNVNSN